MSAGGELATNGRPSRPRRTILDLMFAVVASAGAAFLAVLFGFGGRVVPGLAAVGFLTLLIAGPMFAARDTMRGHPPSSAGEAVWLAQSIGWCGIPLAVMAGRGEGTLFLWYEISLGAMSLAALLVQLGRWRRFYSWKSPVGLLIGLIPGILAMLYKVFGIGAPQAN